MRMSSEGSGLRIHANMNSLKALQVKLHVQNHVCLYGDPNVGRSSTAKRW